MVDSCRNQASVKNELMVVIEV